MTCLEIELLSLLYVCRIFQNPLCGVTGCPLSEVAKYYSALGDNWDLKIVHCIAGVRS